MTCVIGIADGERVVMGADSLGASGWDMTIRRDRKLFRLYGERKIGEHRIVEPFLIGFTDSFRMGQLLHHKLEIPALPPPDGDHEERWLVGDFTDAVRKCLKNGGFARKTEEVEKAGAFLIGWRGRVWEMGSDYQVGEPRRSVWRGWSFAAVGSGFAYALGAVNALEGATRRPPGDLSDHGHALDKLQWTADQVVLEALRVSSEHSAGVSPPFVVINTDIADDEVRPVRQEDP